MLLWVQWRTMRCAQRSALTKDAGVHSTTSVFPVGTSVSAGSASVGVRHWPVFTRAAHANASTAIQSASTTALEMWVCLCRHKGQVRCVRCFNWGPLLGSTRQPVCFLSELPLDVLTVVQQGTIFWRMLRNGLLASFICLVLLNDTLTVKLLDCLLWKTVCCCFLCILQQNNTHLMSLCPGLPGWAGTRKLKPVWILLKQETVSCSDISWAICKSAPRSRQIIMPAPHHSVFLQAGCPSCRPTNSVKALKAHFLCIIMSEDSFEKFPYFSETISGRECHLCQVAGNTVWSHVACEFQ